MTNNNKAFLLAPLLILSVVVVAILFYQRAEKGTSVPPQVEREDSPETIEPVMSEDGRWKLYQHAGYGSNFETWYPADWRVKARDNNSGAAFSFTPPGRVPGSDSGLYLTVANQSLTEFRTQQKKQGVSMIPIRINNADGLLMEGGSYGARYDSGIVLGNESNTYAFFSIHSDEAAEFAHDYQPMLDFIIASFRFAN